ncbi:MAG: hypothetical protein KAF27_11395 [Porphyrobacter sp.]|nr:hypothetical protein [Porphyrobacter sp.]
MPDTPADCAPEPFAARFSIARLLLWAIPSAGLAVVCAPLALGGLTSGKAAAFVIGLAGGAGLLFFGLIAVVQMLRLFDRRPQVIVDKRGVYVRSHGEKVIGLRSIKGLHRDAGRLGITLYKPSKYPIERRHRQFIWKINGSSARGFFGDVWIWTNMLDRTTPAIIEAILAHRPKTDFEREMDEIIAANR